MAQPHRVEGQVELKCHVDKMFDIWAHKLYLVQKTVLNEGEWHKAGAVMTGNYVINEIGESASLKARVKDIDENYRSIRYSYHDGFIMENYYKTFESEMKVSPKRNNNGCILKWTFEYEKMKEDAPDASVYIILISCLALQMIWMLVFAKLDFNLQQKL